MRDDTDPLLLRRAMRPDGLVVARQAPPASSRSFSATFLAPAGYAYDPAGSEGLALTLSHLVGSGAGRRNRIELARELDRRGGTLHARCHPESAEITVWGSVDAFGPLLDLWADVIREPRFASSDLDRVRRQLSERQLRELSQPDSRAERELFRAVFPPGHPYRLTGVGTRDSLRRIDRAGLRRFRRDHYSAEGSFIVVTSPLPLPEVEREVRRRIPDLERPRAPGRPEMPPIRAPSERYRTVEMPGRTQVEVRIGGPSLPRSSEWYPAAYLANEVLGGRPLMSRLFQNVREAHGLAYHASSELEAMRWGGHWLAQAGTGPERQHRVVPLVAAEVERLRRREVPRGTLDAIRESAIGEIPLGLESTSGAHELAVDVAYHELPDDFYRTWPGRLRALTAREVRAAAEIAFDAATSCTIVAGPGSTRTVGRKA